MMVNNITVKRSVNGDVSIKNETTGVVQKPSSVTQYVYELEFIHKEQFPIIGDEDILYIATDENVFYRWDSQVAKYVQLTSKDVSYNDLKDIPKLNGVPITGEKTNEEYGIEAISNLELEDLLK